MPPRAKALLQIENTMSPVTISRPAETEYAPYFSAYVSRVPPGDLIETLRSQIGETMNAFGSLSDADAEYRYAEGKWSSKEVIGHMSDVERIMAYRALAIARGEQQSLPGFDENAYVERAKFGARTCKDLLEELRAVREATIRFFSGLDAEELQRRGKANNKEFSVRALAYIIAGHERHHLTIFRERYLPGLNGRR